MRDVTVHSKAGKCASASLTQWNSLHRFLLTSVEILEVMTTGPCPVATQYMATLSRTINLRLEPGVLPGQVRAATPCNGFGGV